MVTEDQVNWDEHLQFLSMALRSTPNETTGVTPNFMMFGREINMPVDVMIPLPDDQQLTAIEYVTKLCDKLTYAYGLARVNLKKNVARQHKLYNTSHHGETFQVGDLVWYANRLRKKGVAPKLQPKWRGPCLVTKKHNDVLFGVQMSAKKIQNVHSDLLKPCHAVNPPSWLKRARKSLLRG